MTRIFLVRHGQTKWNLEGRLQGWLDSDLSEKGLEQAKRAKERLALENFTTIYSSDRGRALKTATIITDNQESIIQHKDLREMTFGDWEGQLVDDIRENFTDQFHNLFNRADLYEKADGESYYDLKERVLPVLSEIEEKHSGEDVLLVAHGLTIKTILSHYGKKPLSELWNMPLVEGGSISIIEIKDEPKIILYGDTSHLGDMINERKSV